MCFLVFVCIHRYNTNDLGVQGIGFIIQSDKFDAAHLALQVELFVQQTLTRIASLLEVRHKHSRSMVTHITGKGWLVCLGADPCEPVARWRGGWSCLTKRCGLLGGGASTC